MLVALYLERSLLWSLAVASKGKAQVEDPRGQILMQCPVADRLVVCAGQRIDQEG